jgi:hypothetical protein
LATPKSLIPPKLPSRFWKARDAAIEHLLSNSGLPSDLAGLQEWIAIEGWDDLLAAWINEDIVLKFEGWAVDKFSDSCLREAEDLDESEAITDQLRVAYARAAISHVVKNCEGEDLPSVHSFLIERGDGERAILGCTVEIHGQYGPVPQWHGVFANKDDFYRHLRSVGFLFLSEAGNVGDAEILALWGLEAKIAESGDR